MKNYPIRIFTIIIVGLVIILGYRFKDYVIDENHILAVNAPCNPGFESCFDPSSDWSFDEFPYKKVEIVARNAPACLEEHDCEEFTCDELGGCTVTYCSDQTVEDGEFCVVPEVETFSEAIPVDLDDSVTTTNI